MWYSILDKEGTWEELRSKVICERMLISLPFTLPLRVIAFPEEELANVLDLIDYKGDLATTPTSHPKLRLVLTQPITVLLPRGDDAISVEEVLSLYKEELKPDEPILATNPHGKPVPPAEEGVFHIRFYSRPTPGQGKIYPKVFGQTLPPGLSDGLQPSGGGEGLQLMAPEGVIAEIHGNNLYILFDLPHPSPSKELTQSLLARILELWLETRNKKPRSMQARYVEACQRARRIHLARLQGRRRDLVEQISNLERTIRRYKEELSDLEQELEDCRRPEDFAQEFKKLKEIPHVKQVRISGNYLHLHTDEIYLQDQGKTYLIGRYHIKIPLKEGSISIVNEEPKRREDGKIIHHPHVTERWGRVCLGNMKEGMEKYLAEGRYELVAQALIEFLHSVNPDDPFYGNLKYWQPLDKSMPCPCRKGKEVN